MAVSDDSVGTLELEWPFSVAQSWAEMDHDWIWATPGRGLTLDQVSSAAEELMVNYLCSCGWDKSFIEGGLVGHLYVHCRYRWYSILVPIPCWQKTNQCDFAPLPTLHLGLPFPLFFLSSLALCFFLFSAFWDTSPQLAKCRAITICASIQRLHPHWTPVWELVFECWSNALCFL